MAGRPQPVRRASGDWLEHTLRREEKSVKQSPRDKVPARPVPESAQREHRQQIQRGAQRTVAVSAQGM